MNTNGFLNAVVDIATSELTKKENSTQTNMINKKKKSHVYFEKDLKVPSQSKEHFWHPTQEERRRKNKQTTVLHWDTFTLLNTCCLFLVNKLTLYVTMTIIILTN